MFDVICVDLKRSGKGHVVHKPVIKDEDLKRVITYFSSWKNDKILQRKIWLDLMLQFCLRGSWGTS